MTSKTRWIPGVLVALLIVLATPATLAQDDEEESSRGKIYLEVGAWGPTAIGVQDEPASRIDYTTTTTGSTLIGFKHDPSAGFYFRGGYEMHKNLGEFMLTWFDTDEQLTMKEFSPGQPQFGEILAHPVLAGYFNDGVADGFEANSVIKLSDFRIDYGRRAFRSDRFVAKWFIGLRRAKFTRELDATYHALAPPTGVLIPPVADAQKALELSPIPDVVKMRSDFVGRGPEVGMDFRIPLIKNKRLQINGGFALAILRGKIDTAYQSSNAAYVFESPAVTNPAPGVDLTNGILSPPYNFDEFLGTGGENNTELFFRADGTTQGIQTFNLGSNSRSTTSPVMELYVGLNWRIWRGLEIFGGFRDIYYGDAAVDLRPEVYSDLFGLNFQSVTETSRSVEYQGFFLGVGYRF